MTDEKFTRGQELWFVPACAAPPLTVAQLLTVVRIGRRWLRVVAPDQPSTQFRVVRESMVLYDRHTALGWCYRSKEDWEQRVQLDRAWSHLLTQVLGARTLQPEGVTLANIQGACRLLRLKPPPNE